MNQVIKEHEEIYRSIKSDDEKKAAKLVREHLLITKSRLNEARYSEEKNTLA
jgi:DNA-binding GntR family transcriptional regulator